MGVHITLKWGDAMYVVFDAYGTLWNVSRIEAVCAEVIGRQHAQSFLGLWRAKQLDYAFLRTVMERYRSFEKITADALDFTIDAFSFDVNDHGRKKLNQAWFSPQPYEEAIDMLRTLKGHQRIILSNGDPQMLKTGVDAAKMDGLLDAVLSVAPSRHYKPHAAAYQLVCDHFGIQSSEAYFVSSNGWDVAGASTFGFNTVWVNRMQGPSERLGADPVAVIRSLAELPSVIKERYHS